METSPKRRARKKQLLWVATLTSLFLLAPATGQARTEASAVAADSQSIRIMRRGSRPVQQAPDEHFTGRVRIER